MKISPLFKTLFCFSQKEISFAFDHIIAKKYYHGLKLLKTLPPQTEVMATGKLLIITPRAAGKATERNLMRRRLKNIFFQQQCYKAPVNWIIIVSPKANELTFDELKNFLVTHMPQPTTTHEPA